MLESLTKKQKIIFFIILGIMVSVIIYYIYSTLYANDFSFSYENNYLTTNNLLEDTNSSDFKNAETDTIVVYVCGAVKSNQIVTLKENSRVYDAVEAVGGLTEDADLTNINLAYLLEDGEKIYIPKIGEEISNESISSSSTHVSNNKININTASQTLLETIPGVGPSIALKIINYREKNGKFSSIEDIKNISGIGDKKFENIKDYISVK